MRKRQIIRYYPDHATDKLYETTRRSSLYPSLRYHSSIDNGVVDYESILTIPPSMKIIINMEWLIFASPEEILAWLEQVPSNRSFELSDVGPIVKFLSAFTETKEITINDCE